MATKAEIGNDAFQGSANAEEGQRVLGGLSDAVLRAVCDLNHLDDTGGRKALVTRLMADRWQAC